MRHTRLASFLLGLLCLGLWELAVQQLATSALVLPAPTVIASSLWRGLTNGYLWPHVLQTLSEVGLGLLLGGTLGFAGGGPPLGHEGDALGGGH